MPLHQTVIDMRLKTAVKMLITSTQSAEEIGRTVGFPSKSGFYREFTKKFGIPPMQYRKKIKQIHHDKKCPHVYDSIETAV